MARIYLLLEAHDRDIGEEVAVSLQQVGHDTYPAVVERFPIADPLAFRLANVRQQVEAVVVLISRSSDQALWVMREIQTQSAMTALPQGRASVIAIFVGEVQIPAWMRATPDLYPIADDSSKIYQRILTLLDRIQPGHQSEEQRRTIREPQNILYHSSRSAARRVSTSASRSKSAWSIKRISARPESAPTMATGASARSMPSEAGLISPRP